MLKNWLYFVLDVISPQKCIGCHKPGELLCQSCATKTKLAEPTKLNEIFSASNYNDRVIKKAIWLLKYRGAKSIARPLADLALSRLHILIPDIQNFLIIPVPLHKKRLRERGYNQSELLAKHISDKVGAATLTDVLYKTKGTPTQVSIKNKKERLENLRDVFTVKNPEKIKNNRILLIDDVTTTGATLKEAIRVLKNSGAQKVTGLTIARD